MESIHKLDMATTNGNIEAFVYNHSIVIIVYIMYTKNIPNILPKVGLIDEAIIFDFGNRMWRRIYEKSFIKDIRNICEDMGIKFKSKYRFTSLDAKSSSIVMLKSKRTTIKI